MDARHIAIVGGGISGLAVAEAVARRSQAAGAPVRITVLEAESEAGGKIRSARQDGFVVDTGPHGFLDKEPKIFELIERLGLSDRLVKANDSADKRYVLRQGALRALPASPPKFLTSGVLPLQARLRVLMEPWAKKRPEEEESVWSFAARRIGPTAADVLIDAMVTGIYGGDPKQLSLPSAFPRMYELESKYGSLIKAQMALAKEKKGNAGAGGPVGALHSFTDGVGELTSALAALPETQIEKSFVAESLEQEGGAFVVRGPKGALAADAVVLAVPADAAARLLRKQFEPSNAFERVHYASVAVVLQAFAQTEVGRVADGFGFLSPEGENSEVLGSIWASTVFPVHAPEGQVFFRSILGGVRHPERAEGTDEALRARARAALGPLMRISEDAKPTFERVVRWSRGIPQYNVGHGQVVEIADAVEAQVPGIFVTGNAFRGVAMLNCVAYADELAERAVRFLLKRNSATSAA